MTNAVSTSAEHDAELASIARMLAHIRDSARALDAQALEYCVDMALQAVFNELRDRREFAAMGPDTAGGFRLLQ
jgi:hypothetical protein